VNAYNQICIDWDETCFEHYRFLGWLEEFAAETGVLDPRLLETADKYHDQVGENMRLYRHREHIADVLGLEWERFSGEVSQVVRALGIPIQVVHGPKAEYLAKEFGDSAMIGVLIDDKHPLRLPANWDHLWLDRAALLASPVSQPHNVTHIGDLEQATRLVY